MLINIPRYIGGDRVLNFSISIKFLTNIHLYGINLIPSIIIPHATSCGGYNVIDPSWEQRPF